MVIRNALIFFGNLLTVLIWREMAKKLLHTNVYIIIELTFDVATYVIVY